MQCPKENGGGAELILAYTAGTLEPSTQIELERHLASCDGCRQLAAEQKAVWDALDTWRPAAISGDFNDRLYRRISEETAVAWWRRPLRLNWSWPALPVAAACGAIMIAFVVKEPPATSRAPAPAEHKVSIEQVERALDDMDMLKQMSLMAPAEGSRRSESRTL